MSSCLPLFLPPSMSHTPTSLPIPSDILPWNWRPQKRAENVNQHVVLPPISNLDLSTSPKIRIMNSLSPAPSSPSSSSSRLPSPKRSRHNPTIAPPSTTWYGADAPASAVAEKTAEMVCYLWFSSNRELAHRSNTSSSHSRTRHSPTFARMDTAAAALQFAPSDRFTYFIRKILETTQVSQSVIVLSLHYIYRLRQQNNMTAAQEGSEFRVAVVAMMLANKFVDDNTYTNKTWSEVAGIELDELNRMEREFLMGIDSRLYVDKATYESWLQLLKGLVLAKERDINHWQMAMKRPAKGHRHTTRPMHPGSSASALSDLPMYRPRSTSPIHSAKHNSSFTFNVPHNQAYAEFSSNQSMDTDQLSSHAGGKRSALSAFDQQNPSSARPHKRAIMLHTNGLSGAGGPRSAGPAFNVSSTNFTPSSEAFARLSLSNSSNLCPPATHSPYVSSSHANSAESQILARPYTLDQKTMDSQPQRLFFYSLSGSPADSAAYDAASHRKAKLHYVPSRSPVMYHPVPHSIPPLVIQSANASLRNLASLMNSRPPYALRQEHFMKYVEPRFSGQLPRISQPNEVQSEMSVPAAHFANAGPPGVHWIATTPVGGPAPLQHNRGRPF